MKTYEEVKQWLFSQVPVFQKEGAAAYKPGLEKIHAFDAYLNSPASSLKSIHIAGTNGKGSTAHMLAAILQTKGYKVGLYTSPHLVDFSERIRVNGQPIPPDYVIDFVNKHRAFFQSTGLSFFEITVGMAFAYFEMQEVDYAVVEVGLGGRLDATNILQPELSVITNIGLDHTEFLGTTLKAIAFEKGGIIKPNTPVIIGEKHEETQPVFDELASKQNAPIRYVAHPDNPSIATDLRGAYQVRNVNTVCTIIETLFGEIEQDILEKALLNVVPLTGLRGRWEQIGSSPLTLVDVTHNEAGFRYVRQQLLVQKAAKLHLVLGFVKGKNIAAILSLLPKQAHFYFCQPEIPRALPIEEIVPIAQSLNLSYALFSSLNEAVVSAKRNAQTDDLVYIGGSTFVVAEVLE